MDQRQPLFEKASPDASPQERERIRFSNCMRIAERRTRTERMAAVNRAMAEPRFLKAA